jgi:F-type H+-transporting ATPase subunit a
MICAIPPRTAALLAALLLLFGIAGPLAAETVPPPPETAAAPAGPETTVPAIEEETGGDEEPPELPSVIALLYHGAGAHGRERPAWLGFLYRFQDIVYALIVAGVIIALVRLGTRRMALIPGRLQNAVEFFIEAFRDFILSILGPAGEPYVPFLGSLFLYIWFMNLIGLVPLMKSPTSTLSTTSALAICVFLYVQWIGLRRLGPVRYFRHLAGDPQDAIGWGMVPLLLPIHVIGELARPVSLSLRLFGNILGEDVLIGIFAGLGVAVVAFLKLPVGIPFHLPFILLAMLMSTVQALVFTLLSTVYIMQVLPHESEEAGH